MWIMDHMNYFLFEYRSPNFFHLIPLKKLTIDLFLNLLKGEIKVNQYYTTYSDYNLINLMNIQFLELSPLP
jgi:hypothetical protein